MFGVAMLAPTLLAAASEEIKKKFLPGIANAELMWCELWSEPNCRVRPGRPAIFSTTQGR